jgi:hypothetical protein
VDLFLLNRTVESDVARGVELLNEHGPVEWWTRVDLTRLDMQATISRDDLLGQLFGDEETGLEDLAYATGGSLIPEDFGLEARTHTGYPALTQEWRKQVRSLVWELSL